MNVKINILCEGFLNMDSFFKKLLLDRDKLSKLEKEVLDYFMEKPEIIKNHTLEEISKKMFVSTATISRTCKKLGFEGFTDLRYSLLIYQQNNKQEPKKVRSEPIAKQLERFKNELNENISSIGSGIDEKIMDLVKNSNHVEFFGVGSSLPVCIEGARKMTFTGRIATARSDWDELRVVARNLTSNDLAIIISLSGETLHVIEYANILKENSVPTIAITGTKNSHLEELTTFILSANLESYYYDDIDMSSRFPLNMIVDLIILEYLNTQEKM